MISPAQSKSSPHKHLLDSVSKIFVLPAIIALSYGLMWKLSRVRDFDPDEFEHLHAAWCVARGMVPYRDFFEHHTPWFYYFLAPFIQAFNADSNPDSVIQFLFFSRTLMWLLTGGIIVLVYALGRSWRDSMTGLVAAAFFMNTLLVVEKSLETRPDLFSTIFWLGCLWFALRACQATAAGDERTASQSWAWSGILWGAALMFSQKLLMAAPGLLLTALWNLADGRIVGTLRRKLGNIALFTAGAAGPVLLSVLYFAWHGAFSSFIHHNFLLNFGWLSHIPPDEHIRRLVGQNPVFVTLALAGCLRLTARLFRSKDRERGDFILVLNFIGLLAGLFLLPVAQRQYFLTFLPLGALFASMILMELFAGIARRDRASLPEASAVLVAGAVIWAAINVADIPIMAPRHLMYAWAAFPFAAALLLFLRSPNGAAAVFLTALSIHSIKQVSDAFLWRNDITLRSVRYLHEHTSPADTIMDGWKGFGVFRPHAYFYYFLHEEIRTMLSEEQRSALLDDLEGGRIRPKFIILDEHLRGFFPRLSRFFFDHYAPSADPLIWERKIASPTRSE